MWNEGGLDLRLEVNSGLLVTFSMLLCQVIYWFGVLHLVHGTGIYSAASLMEFDCSDEVVWYVISNKYHLFHYELYTET